MGVTAITVMDMVLLVTLTVKNTLSHMSTPAMPTMVNTPFSHMMSLMPITVTLLATMVLPMELVTVTLPLNTLYMAVLNQSMLREESTSEFTKRCQSTMRRLTTRLPTMMSTSIITTSPVSSMTTLCTTRSPTSRTVMTTGSTTRRSHTSSSSTRPPQVPCTTSPLSTCLATLTQTWTPSTTFHQL